MSLLPYYVLLVRATKICLFTPMFFWTTSNCFATSPFIRTAGGPSNDRILDMVEDSQGNTYVVGTYMGEFRWLNANQPVLGTSNGDNADVFVAKVSHTGTLVWTHFISGESGAELVPTALTFDGSGNVVIVGAFKGTVTFYRVLLGGLPFFVTSTSNGNSYDGFVFSLDADAKPNWRVTLRGDYVYPRSIGFGVHIPGDHKLIVAGDFIGAVGFNKPGAPPAFRLSNPDSQDFFLAKMNPGDGAVSQSGTTSIGGNNVDIAHAVIGLPGGNLVVAGEFGSQVDFDPDTGPANEVSLTASGTTSDGFVLGLTPEFDFKWVRHFKSVGGARFTCLTKPRAGDSEGDFFAGGDFAFDLTTDSQTFAEPGKPGCFTSRFRQGNAGLVNVITGDSSPMNLFDIGSDPSFGAIAVGNYTSGAVLGGRLSGERGTRLSAVGTDGFIWTLDSGNRNLQVVRIRGAGRQSAHAVTGDDHGFHTIAGEFGAGSDCGTFPRRAALRDRKEISQGGSDGFLYRRYFHPAPQLSISRFGAKGVAVGFKGVFNHTYYLSRSSDLVGGSLAKQFINVGNTTNAWLDENAMIHNRRQFYHLNPGVPPQG